MLYITESLNAKKIALTSRPQGLNPLIAGQYLFGDTGGAPSTPQCATIINNHSKHIRPVVGGERGHLV
jgi:hypothetical protein